MKKVSISHYNLYRSKFFKRVFLLFLHIHLSYDLCTWEIVHIYIFWGHLSIHSQFSRWLPKKLNNYIWRWTSDFFKINQDWPPEIGLCLPWYALEWTMNQLMYVVTGGLTISSRPLWRKQQQRHSSCSEDETAEEDESEAGCSILSLCYFYNQNDKQPTTTPNNLSFLQHDTSLVKWVCFSKFSNCTLVYKQLCNNMIVLTSISSNWRTKQINKLCHNQI